MYIRYVPIPNHFQAVSKVRIAHKMSAWPLHNDGVIERQARPVSGRVTSNWECFV